MTSRNQCTVCNHPQRDEIERRMARGVSYATLKREYGISRENLSRHKRNHLTPELVQAAQIRSAEKHFDVLAELDELVLTAKTMLEQAQDKNKTYEALHAMRELNRNLELISKIQYAAYQANQQNPGNQPNGITEEDESRETEKLSALACVERDVYFGLLLKMDQQHDNPIPGIEYCSSSFLTISADTTPQNEPLPPEEEEKLHDGSQRRRRTTPAAERIKPGPIEPTQIPGKVGRRYR